MVPTVHDLGKPRSFQLPGLWHLGGTRLLHRTAISRLIAKNWNESSKEGVAALTLGTQIRKFLGF